MPNLENLRKQAKLILRWRDRYHPVAAQIRSGLSRYSRMTDSEILAQSFKLGDAQELVARQRGFESWQALKTGLMTMSHHAETISTKPSSPKVRLRIKLCACTDFSSQMALSKWSPWHKADSQLLTGEYAVLLGVSCPQ